MKILITGSSGFIAYHLIKQLCGMHELHCVDRNDYKSKRMDELKQPNHNINFYTDELKSFDIIRQINPDIIIHLAAESGVSNSFNNPSYVLKHNTDTFLNVIEGIRNINPKIKLIYASSSSVYGNTTKDHTENNDELCPMSAYALSKLMNEQTAQLYFNNYDIKSIGLRFFTVYGEYNRKDMLVGLLLDAFSSGGDINLYNGGNMSRSFTYVGDVSNIIGIFVDEISSFERHDIFNVGGESVSLSRVYESFEKNFTTRPNLINAICPRYSPINTVCDNRKLLTYFDDLKFVNIDDGIKKLCDHYKCN